MKEEIKAINTEYNGYRFRSRLEARVAVFFDAAGIQYEYEQEGYVRVDGVAYLPDFYLPEWDMFVEVKPLRKGFSEEITKATMFLGEKIKGLMVITEIPKPTENSTWFFPVLYKHPISEETILIPLPILMSMEGDSWMMKDAGISYENEVGLGWWSSHTIEKYKYKFKPINATDFEEPDETYKLSDCNENELMKEAYKKAYQARFEHGEKG
jgi:hypothetical protein